MNSCVNNLKEMNKFLEKYSLPWLNHEERENMNRSIRNIKIETIIKNLTTNKSPGPCRFTVKFYQTFREEFLKRFQQVTEQGQFSNSFYEATITLIPKPDKYIKINK